MTKFIDPDVVFETRVDFKIGTAIIAQSVRSLTPNQEVPGSIPGLVEG